MKALLAGKNFKKGFATLEILIAFAVIILSISAVVMVVFGNQSIAVDTQNNNEAVSKAQSGLETARANSRFDFNLVNPSTSTDSSAPFFTNKIDVDTAATDPTLDFFTKRVTSTVTWQTAGRTLSAIVTTLLTNSSAVNGGNTCSSVLAGDWKNPKMFPTSGYDFGADLLGVNANGFSLTGLKSFNKKLYVTVDAVPGSYHANNKFFIFDTTKLISNPSQALMGAGDDVSPGLKAVAIDGNYAYVANTSINGQLQVLDISGASPVLKATLKLSNVTGSGTQALGNKVFYSNGYVYLGLTRTASGPEFNIIDVGGGGLPASPINPIWKGSYPIANTVNSIYIKNGFAYVASPNHENLTILNITTPSAPTRAGGLTPSDAPEANGVGSNHGKSLSVIGNNVYLGRTYGPKEFYIIDATKPSALTFSSKDTGSSNANSINGLTIRDYLAFFLTNGQFQVWNISDTSNIYPWTSSQNTSEFLTLPSGSGTDVDCENNYFYFVSDSSQGNHKDILAIIEPGVPQVYTLNTPSNITLAQGASGNTTITRSHISGDSTNVSLNISSPSPLPTGVTTSFTNNPCAPSPTCSSVLTVNTTSTTPVGTYPITITGTDGTSTSFNLIVTPAFDYSLSAAPASITVTRSGSSVSDTITLTMVSGATPQQVSINNSTLPSGVTAAYSPVSKNCIPSATTPYQCIFNISFSASGSATLGSKTITFTGTPLSKTTTIILNIIPAFTYTISGEPSTLTINKGGTLVSLTAIITMAAGAVPQLVTLTAPNPAPLEISVTPASTLSCTPSSTTPYTCSATFKYSAISTAVNKTYNSQKITGSPNATSSSTFKIQVK